MEKQILELINRVKEKLIDENEYQKLLYKFLIASDELLKLKYYHLLTSEKDKCNILLSTYNDNIKINMLNTLNSSYYIGEIIDSLSNDDLKLNYLSLIKNSNILHIIVMNFTSDDAKIKCFPLLESRYKYQLICLLNSDEKKIECLSFVEDGYKIEVIKTLKNKNSIIKGYNNIDDIDIKRLIIKYINDKELKKILVKLFVKESKNKLYNDIVATNTNSGKVLRKINLNNNLIDIPGDISVGVELEVCFLSKEDRDNFIGLFLGKSIFDKWNVKYDSSVNNGLEITSPILFFNDDNNIKELYYICKTLRKRKLFTDESCGGHIHLGFDYFTNANEFMTFLNLYQSVEEILYIICNRKNTDIREKATKYAKYSKNNICSVLNRQITNGKMLELSECVNLVKNSQIFGRGYGLNILNIGNMDKNTIEFRFPNGEIDFTELLYNIRLLTKLFEKSRCIANNSNSSDIDLYRYITSIYTCDNVKFNLLLELLFDNKDVEKYIQRYKKNKTKKLIKVLNN